MTEGGEQQKPSLEFYRGQEKYIPYKKEGGTRVVIGRNPRTSSARIEDAQEDDVRFKLPEADSTISRRAVIIDIFPKRIVLYNTSKKDIHFRTDEEKAWSKVPPGAHIHIANSIEKMRNFGLQIDPFTIKAGNVGGKERALQSLILS